jgi:hypothetical protein
LRQEVSAGSLPGILLVVFSVVSCGGSDTSSTSTTPAGSSPAAVGTTVQVSVNATDPDNDQLHYRWAATEGTITNVDAPKTTWVVPPGSGLQFAYVVVSDNKGGYTESRAAVLTYGQPAVTTAATITPSSPIGNPGFVWGSVFYKPASFGRNVYLPGVTVTLSNGKSAITDMKGQFFISNVPDGNYSATYTIPGRAAVTFVSTVTVAATTNNLPTSPSSPNFFSEGVDLASTLNVAGSVRLADFSYCGIRDEFFTLASASNMFTGPISGTAQLLDTANNPLSSSFPINHYGDFLIVRSAVVPGTQAKVRIRCENSPVTDSATLTLPASGAVKLSSSISITNSRPTIGTMTVLLNGQDVGRPDLPKPRTLFTSVDGTPARFGDADLIAEIIDIPGDDTFFTYKGIDTRKSACAYYRAIGAVEGCDVNGFPTGAQLTLDQWRGQFNLSPFPTGNPANPPAPDGQEIRIQYINKSDLNLARDMQAIKLANGDLAYNTCNYPGPQDVTSPLGAPKEIGAETQADIDLSLENARRGIGMIACVAMDYTKSSQITRFYTFGPSGKLLLSLSLDGRREKFMPGTCTTCHGGDAYGGRYPDDESGRPDLKSRWQPFDMANLKVRFGSSQDLAVANAAVKALNQRMVGPGYEPMTTQRTKDLISNWYAGGRLDQDPNFIPTLSYAPSLSLYQKVTQPFCQTCHAAQKVNEFIDANKVCGGSTVLEQNHVMTNSLVPFERFWLDSTTLIPLMGLPCTDKPARHPAL